MSFVQKKTLLWLRKSYFVAWNPCLEWSIKENIIIRLTSFLNIRLDNLKMQNCQQSIPVLLCYGFCEVLESQNRSITNKPWQFTFIVQSSMWNWNSKKKVREWYTLKQIKTRKLDQSSFCGNVFRCSSEVFRCWSHHGSSLNKWQEPDIVLSGSRMGIGLFHWFCWDLNKGQPTNTGW